MWCYDNKPVLGTKPQNYGNSHTVPIQQRPALLQSVACPLLSCLCRLRLPSLSLSSLSLSLSLSLCGWGIAPGWSLAPHLTGPCWHAGLAGHPPCSSRSLDWPEGGAAWAPSQPPPALSRSPEIAPASQTSPESSLRGKHVRLLT